MPRKQRFKPSRKPKASPQTEAAAIGHDARSMSHTGAHNDNLDTGGAVHKSDEDRMTSPETDPRY
jgi:hypothetical protein